MSKNGIDLCGVLSVNMFLHNKQFRGCCGRDRIVVGFIATYAISAYHH